MIKKEYKAPTQKAIEIDGEAFMQSSMEQPGEGDARNSLFNNDEDYDW